jgi:hypothetical protein
VAQTATVSKLATDYIPSGERIAERLLGLEDPKTNTGHHLQYSFEKTPLGGAQIDVEVELRQGWQNEEEPGDLLMSWNHEDIKDKQLRDVDIPHNVANQITDYEDVWICFRAWQRG